ncbi:MAG TPA: hemerythrin domain-containing protein [Rhizomicrobium sp.]
MALMNNLTKAREQIGKARSPRNEGETDILDKLKQEHEEVDALLKQLVDTDSGSTRKSLLKKIKTALVPHLRAEQKVVYDAIIALRDKEAKVDGEEGHIEHQLAERVLLSLDKMASATSPEFTAGSKVLKELVEHHVEEEERNVWKDVREHFSDEERVEMCKKFEAAKTKVRIPS